MSLNFDQDGDEQGVIENFDFTLLVYCINIISWIIYLMSNWLCNYKDNRKAPDQQQEIDVVFLFLTKWSLQCQNVIEWSIEDIGYLAILGSNPKIFDG